MKEKVVLPPAGEFNDDLEKAARAKRRLEVSEINRKKKIEAEQIQRDINSAEPYASQF